MRTISKILATFVVVLCIGTANAQITLSAQRVSLAENDRTILEQQVSRYTAFTVDTRELTNYLNSRGGAGQFRLHIDRNLDWTIDLELNDLRTPDFRREYITPEGTFVCEEPFVVNTFQGRTSSGHKVAFTIDENTFFGIILGENYHYTIRSVDDNALNRRTDNYLIVYHSWDIIPDENYSHFIHDTLQAAEDEILESIEQINPQSAVSCGFVLRMATVADAEFRNIHGANTNNHIMSIINAVSAVYRSHFTNFRIAVSNQRVYTTNPVYLTSSNVAVLMPAFRNQWISNHTNISRNVVHLFTGKAIYYRYDWNLILGAAWGPGSPFWGTFGIGNYLGYAINTNHNRMTALVAHELGHNLTATHPPANSGCGCESSNSSNRSIMCGFLTTSNNLWFCTFSFNQILNFLNSNNWQMLDICGFGIICGTGVFSLSSVHMDAFWSVSPGFTITSPPMPWLLTNTVTVAADGLHGQTGTLTANVLGLYTITRTISACRTCPNGTPNCIGRCPLCRPICPIQPCRCCINPCICGDPINCSCQPPLICLNCNTPWPCNCFGPIAYPNPTGDILIIDMNRFACTGGGCCIGTTYSIRLLDERGSIVRQQQARGGQVEFDVSRLPEGTYFLHIEGGGEIRREQIIIRR